MNGYRSDYLLHQLINNADVQDHYWEVNLIVTNALHNLTKTSRYFNNIATYHRFRECLRNAKKYRSLIKNVLKE